MTEREFKTISKKTRALLNKEESVSADFKRNINAVTPEDLVAFANSASGGTILVGVDEITTASGQQRGKIVGCEIGDVEKLKVIDKALSCTPAVEVEIYLENTQDKPIYRIEIPSGKKKPYCTARGVYSVREDGRNSALIPEKLLDIYIEEQGNAFLQRFAQATEELARKLDQTAGKINRFNQEIGRLRQEVGELSQGIKAELGEVFLVAKNANTLSDAAREYSEQATADIAALKNEVGAVKSDLETVNQKLAALLEQLSH